MGSRGKEKDGDERERSRKIKTQMKIGKWEAEKGVVEEYGKGRG